MYNFWTQAKLTPNAMNGTIVQDVANDQLTAGIPVIYKFVCPDGATGDVDFVLAAGMGPITIIDAWALKTGGAGGGVNTVQVQTGAAAAVTSAMDLNLGDAFIGRTTTIDDATRRFAAGDTLRLHRVRAAGHAGADVFILAMRTA